MILDIEFEEDCQILDVDFGEIQDMSDGGYERGYAEGETVGYEKAVTEAEAHNAEILNDCNAVLPSKGVETADSLEQVPQRIGEIAVVEDYLRLVGNPKFPGLGVFDKEEVVLNFDIADYADRMLYVEGNQKPYPNTKVKHLTMNFAQKVKYTRQAVFHDYNDTVLEHLTLNADISESTNCLQMIIFWKVLRVIDGTPLNLSSSTNNTNIIQGCESLEEIRFAPNTIKVSIGLNGSGKLSDASIQSIIDGLAEVATMQKVTFHTDVLLRLTEEQLLTINAKNWEF